MIRLGLLLLSTTLYLQAQVLDVKQLFNRKLVRVQSTPYAKEKIYYANTALDESRIYDVTLRFSGFVEKLYVSKTFENVHKGDPLFVVYSKALSEIKAEMDLAREMRQWSALHSLKKKLALLDAGSKINKDYTLTIHAPTSGIILEKHINQGSFMKSGTLLYKIADLSTLWVKIQVYQQDLSLIHKGMKATIMIEGQKSREGVIDFIYPFMNPKTKMVDVRVLIDNPNATLYPNLFAKVLLRSPQKTLLTLPKSAVLTKGEKHFVFKPINGNEFEPLEVDASRLDVNTYVIKTGLNKGDKVIDRALFMLDADAITNGLYENDDDWGDNNTSEQEWAW